MFLTDLIQTLHGEQAKRGNVELSGARVAHEDTLLVDHNGGAFDLDDEDALDRFLERFLPLPLEERLKSSAANGSVPLTHDELAQLLEFKAECLAPDLDEEERALMAQGKNNPPGAPVVEVPKDANMRAIDLEGKGTLVQTPCNQYDEQKRGCMRPFGHDGDHLFEAGVVARPVEAALANKAAREAVEAHINSTEKPQE